MTLTCPTPWSSFYGDGSPDRDRQLAITEPNAFLNAGKDGCATETASGIYITVHGHFYQPPRENPHLDAIEHQPSAAPFHDWNERIYHECYRPNAYARILNDQGQIINIINNFEYLSFNIGPTLMNWLKRYDTTVYDRILEADRLSCERLCGHGNAIAQVYNHLIMPLANQRDKITQVRWGKADFRNHFHRDPEGMWLAETAVDAETLSVLIAEGIKFIILAPSQAENCRPLGTNGNPQPQWQGVGGGQIDTTRPYRCYVSNSNPDDGTPSPFIDIFFYDGPISRDMGFGEVLYSSYHFAKRLGLAIRGDNRPSQLISVATDGETFGHHKHGVERCLAYAFAEEFPRLEWTVTNFAHYLSICPPTWEVQLKPLTAWSCVHGVDRWQGDCGCGGSASTQQQWRRPLRNALDWLRDELITIYEKEGRDYFRDVWQARDQYIQVIHHRQPSVVNDFLAQQCTHTLTPTERVNALKLLEMQRHGLLMYTSCGWFFEEISRPEGTQILRYGARSVQLAAEVGKIQLEDGLVNRLADAPSNVAKYGNGSEIYDQLVKPSRVTLRQVAAHYAISSLFTTYAPTQQFYCYTIHQFDVQLHRLGSLTLSVGALQLVSDITEESEQLIFAVLHLGGWDFHCCLQTNHSEAIYQSIQHQLIDVFLKASASQTLLRMEQLISESSFNLSNLLAEDRHRIIRLLTQTTLSRLDQLYTQVYRDNYGILVAFREDELEVPQELQVAAEVSLSCQVLDGLESLKRVLDQPLSYGVHLNQLEAIAREAHQLGCQLHLLEARSMLEQLASNLVHHFFLTHDPEEVVTVSDCLLRLLRLSETVKLPLNLVSVQELVWNKLQSQSYPTNLEPFKTELSLPHLDGIKIPHLLAIAHRLGVFIPPQYISPTPENVG